MESPVEKNGSIYGLLTELSKRIYDKYHVSQENPYIPKVNDNKRIIKKLRTKAYGILLNKTQTETSSRGRDENDPIVELLKYVYLLKVVAKRLSDAEDLERILEEFSDIGENSDRDVYRTLQFLNGLRDYNVRLEPSLNIFHYGKPNPLLPEIPRDVSKIPQFQIYPLESFLLPDAFDAILGIQKECIYSSTSKLSFVSRLKSMDATGIEPLGCESKKSSLISKSMMKFSKEFTMGLYFLPPFLDDTFEEHENCQMNYFQQKEEFTVEPFSPWSVAQFSTMTFSDTSDTPNEDFCSPDAHSKDRNEEIVPWDQLNTELLSNRRTWETLGRLEPPKEPKFLTETNDAMIHLLKIEQANIVESLPERTVNAVHLVEEISLKDFVRDTKLLLLGVESSTFTFDPVHGFKLDKNYVIPGISTRSLDSLTKDIIHSANCFRALSTLVKLDPQTGKLQHEGLIFKAMCNSVKEFLLHYQATIMRIPASENGEILSLLRMIRPVMVLVTEVARLCKCDNQQDVTKGLYQDEGGIGILTHIYQEVTKLTKPDVSLVFYSILKSCCEVYFRLLQKWIFEGICDDLYGEFMIKIRSQYLQEEGHRFWRKAFGIDMKCVPGFLSNLTESILQCGKTVRLLKMCDPKNPLCEVFATSQPQLKVCLSSGMLREQVVKCQDYHEKGEKAMGGNIVTISSAIQEKQNLEKEKAQLVILAQQDTLARLQREREEALMKIAQRKREFLAQLKEQAEEFASNKEKEKEAELLLDKLLMEKIVKEDEEARNLLKVEKENVQKFYKELAKEAENRRLHANWRIRRMELFDQRVSSISAFKKEFQTAAEASESPVEAKESEIVVSEEPDAVDKPILDSKEKALRILEVESEIKSALLKEFEKKEDPVSNLNPPKMKVEGGGKEGVEEKTNVNIILDSDKTGNIGKILAESPILNTRENVGNNEGTGTLEENGNPVEDENSNLRNSNFEETSKIQCQVEENFSEFSPVPKRPTNLEINPTSFRETKMKNERSVFQQLLRDNVTDDFQRELVDGICDKNRNEILSNFTAQNTEAQRNRLKVLGVEFGMTPNNNEKELMDVLNQNKKVSIDLSEAQKNRQKNMAHYDWNETKVVTNVKRNEPVTDLQRNRMRNLSHRTEQGIIVSNSVAAVVEEIETPMSCTTDGMAVSISSLTNLEHLEEETPISELNTDFEDILTGDPQRNAFEFPRIQPDFGCNGSQFFSRLEINLPDNFEDEKTQITMADVEIIDNLSLQMYLEKSVLIPLQSQSRLVNNGIIKYLVEEHQLLSHLHSLRSFYFLLNGEFARSLTSTLYNKLYVSSTPNEMFNSATLTSFLERALMSSLSGSFDNSERLSLSAVNTPEHLQVTNPEALDCLCLNYKVSWPLNILLDKILIQHYSKVFKYLLTIGRVLWVLQEDFHILKVESRSTHSQQYHKLQLYRYSMMQFINALHNYVTCSVLHASWSEFEKDLKNSVTLDQVYHSHVLYIKRILSKCMLNPKSETIRNALNNVFKVILKFHNRLRSHAWTTNAEGHKHPNYNKLEQLYQGFCDLRAYLAHVAYKLATSGYEPHLIHFLHTLNVNYRYDLVNKRK